MDNVKKRWLTRKECSAEYNIPVASLDCDRVTKTRGFPYVKIGRKVLYDRQEMDKFFEARKCGGAA